MCTLNTVKADVPERRNNKASKILCGMATNMLKHAFLLFRAYLDMFLDVIFGYFFEDEKKKVVPDLEKRHTILTESAVALAAKIRNKELTSEQLVQTCIERIKLVNPILNAVIDERFEAALKDAKEIDKKIAEGLPEEYFKEKPFLGVPFTAKESHAVAGMLHPLGLVSRGSTRAHSDAACVRALRAAGAIPLAVTNVPEFNKWQETRNMLNGQTNNPYHAGRSPGGSSGGEAALAASFASPISLCSDIGGSTRMPAFYCGLFALNPTPGFSSLEGSALRTNEHDATTMASIGFVSRHCADLAPLTELVAPALALHTPVDLRNVTYYYTETAKDLRVSPICKDLREAMTKVITKLTEVSSSTSAAPKQYYHRALGYSYSLWRHNMTREAEYFPRQLAGGRGEVNGIVELVKKIFGMSQFTLAAIIKVLDDQVLPAVNKQWGDQLTKELADDLKSKLGTNGVLIFPSAPLPAPYHYSAFLRPFNFAYWGVLNAIKFPAVQVPLGLNSQGLPLGVQVVAAPENEALCLAVADYLNKEFGGFVPPCKVLQ